VQRVLVVAALFITDGLFFPFFSFSSPENHKFVLFVVDISTLALIILYFFLDFFVKVLIVFNFIL
jgi:hypothetical protein